MSRSFTKAPVTVSCAQASRTIRMFAKATRKRATKPGPAGRRCSNNFKMLKLMRVWVLTFALPLVACAASLQISGPYANRLSKTDIEQLKVLVSKEARIDHRLKKIEAVRPDKVGIRTGGRTAVDSATYNDFNAYKRAGR